MAFGTVVETMAFVLGQKGAAMSTGISFCGKVGWLQHIGCPLDWASVVAPSPVLPKLAVHCTVTCQV